MQHNPTPGVPGQYPPAAKRRQPVFDPGPFRRGDFVVLAAYLLLFIVGLAGFLLFIPGFRDVFTTPDTAQFAVNLIAYAVLFTGAMIMSFSALRESFRTFLYHPWAKGFLVPGAWLGSLIVTASILMTMGEAVKSENQLAIEGMTTSVPFPTMFVAAVVMGPFVEEYIFRHLLIGKLSRWINVWVCVAISILLFAGIHFVGAGSFDVTSLVPYLTLGTVISVAYVLSGKSLAYSYVLHLFNNGVALVLAYTVLPLLEQ
ncbi:CPBP family intramembrane glutamic endopeptidase [Arthrobacter halodurans]|uniref:Lysostaphin resistance A-like protein n=1 Tax=Arthrobacter halodurans TaxID=516699 RepID=A0ABV4UKS8_9MICC